MKYEEYLRQRKELSDKAGALIEEGKTEEANTVMNDITALDEQYEASCKQKANLDALNGNVKSKANGILGSTGDSKMEDDAEKEKKMDFASDKYLDA